MTRTSEKRRSNTPSRRLKRQPRLKRVNAAAAARTPRLVLPKTAVQRRKRNRRPNIKIPTEAIWTVVLSPRWISLSLLVLSLYVLTTLGSSTNFYLTIIPVEGVFSISPDEIVVRSGLAGRHIFAANPTQAAASIAETPGIVEASVRLNWPNQVTISIVEDTPIAVWEQAGETFWINQSGELLPARINVPGLLRIQTDSSLGVIGYPASTTDPAAAVTTETQAEAAVETAPAVYQSLGLVPSDIVNGALLLQKLQPSGQTISALSYNPDSGLSYRDDRGWNVYLGTGVDMRQKLALHEAIVTEIFDRGETPVYVSVSNKDKPFFMANAAP